MKRPPFVVKHLIPAPGWLAVYTDYFADRPDETAYVPLVGWAVVAGWDVAKEDSIVPMVQTLDCGVMPAEEDNLLGVIHESQRERVSDWVKIPGKKGKGKQ